MGVLPIDAEESDKDQTHDADAAPKANHAAHDGLKVLVEDEAFH